MSAPPLIDDCYACGDGVVQVGGQWEHSDDLAIDVDGKVVETACHWGKPYIQVDDLFDTDSLEYICPECWECGEANAEPPYGVVEVMAAYCEQLRHCKDRQSRACAGLT